MTDYKVIFHIDEMNKWDLLLGNVSNLLKAAGEDKYSIEVLANAEAVKHYDLKHGLTSQNVMESLSNDGVKFVACNNALMANDLKRDTLFTFVEIVPAGVVELIIKQSEGYCYIKP
ncbi:hypothetical protein Desaci_2783 [Desulfosporosinus acidiphilus SJ4]|uniref:Uncharacterized protein n=1 Tax=Desulfosporosinus acidiphilus (strain DSM 22704 / JCM 16185 / SJ4) TaxID=646529 RepID=I4D7D4_DESAJ|nr:DsrE family protein [Desulfosporosinus acidiphilus]AFM41708.1 hypothetical protein Desaci_2783 [Desulfosporosinus acidiphilus SJ4]